MTQDAAVAEREEVTQVAGDRFQGTAEDFVPPKFWGVDHWKTLAYIDTVMTDCAGFEVGLDPRMRAGRRMFRVLAQDCPTPKRANGTSGRSAASMARPSDYPTRLRGGQELANHDDWNCVQDMAAANLFDVGPDSVQPGRNLRFSAKGQAWVGAYRQFKQNGGQAVNFSAEGLPEMPECTSAQRETYTYNVPGGFIFEVTDALDAIKAGTLKPKLIDLPPEFIAEVAQQAMGLTPGCHLLEKRPMRMTVAYVDEMEAMKLPEEAMAQPLMLAKVGVRRRPWLTMFDDKKPAHIFVDGYHRMAKHFLEGRTTSMKAYVLTTAQANKFIDA